MNEGMVRFKDKEGPKYVAPYYPIGFIVLTMSNQNPSYWFGGTWERIAKGRVLVGVDENDTDFNVAGKTGGSKYIQSHTHKGIYFWGNPNRYVTLNGGSDASAFNINSGSGLSNDNSMTTGDVNGTTGNAGNWPPNFTCYIWCRMA